MNNGFFTFMNLWSMLDISGKICVICHLTLQKGNTGHHHLYTSLDWIYRRKMDIIAANISRMIVNFMKCTNDTAGEKYEFTYNTP